MTTLLKTLVTSDLTEAAHLIAAGQLVIFPTETVYGLGADALNPEAVRGIYAAKNRPSDNPLIVHIHDFKQVDELARDVPDYARRLMKAFFPGSLTLLLWKRPIVPDTTTADSPKVCLRMPSLEITRRFLKACSVPVAAPSANLSGKPSPTKWEDCLEDMDGRVAAILKGPEADFGVESTIVDCTSDAPILMRPGAISLEALAEVVPDITVNPEHTAVALPGMKYRHYAPQARMELLDAYALPRVFSDVPTAYIGINPPLFATEFSFMVANTDDYAHYLFAFLRECDRRGIRQIFAERVAVDGMGRALMNRLTKAATPEF